MPAPEFKVNTSRYDPYKSYRFRVKWDGRYVAGISRVGGLTRSTEVVTYREGGDPSTVHKSPGQTSYQAITLERGVTQDRAFEQWANQVWNYQSSLSPDAQNLVSLADFRKPITIELYNEAGQKVLAYNVYRCWVSEYTALPELDASGSAVAIQSMTLENEGWDRDTSIVETPEPSNAIPLS